MHAGRPDLIPPSIAIALPHKQDGQPGPTGAGFLALDSLRGTRPIKFQTVVACRTAPQLRYDPDAQKHYTEYTFLVTTGSAFDASPFELSVVSWFTYAGRRGVEDRPR